MNIVILAGGVGSRLWPMSRQEKPKQFYEILSKDSMLRDTFNRFKSHYDLNKIFISSNIKFKNQLEQEFSELNKEQFIFEPHRRDTGSAMGYACLYLSLKAPDEPMAFIPADHYIADIPRFIHTLKAAEKKIIETGKMIDIAIQPNFPSTVLGYTHIGASISESDQISFYEFLGHKEKPEYELAKVYVESGEHLWHANYYMWTPRLFLNAYQRYVPHTYDLLRSMEGYLNQKDFDSISTIYSKMDKISVDYAITEQMDPKDVLIIKGDFGWSDIGAWDVLYDQMKKEKCDNHNNIVRGNCMNLDTHNSLIYGNKDKMIATIGINDMIIVDTDDALLICPQGRAQDVKKIVSKIEDDDFFQYL